MLYFFCQLFPLLVQSLLCDNVQLQQSTMDTLCTMITDAPDFLVKHVDSVIPQLLKLTTYKPAMVSSGIWCHTIMNKQCAI